MNCFFVSCEIAENPELKGQKVAVAPIKSDRKGIILAASYEARHYGIRSAMRVSDALRLCPDLILVEPSMDLYSEYSNAFFDYFMSITPLVEPASIDEGYLDITDVCKPEEVMQFVANIQKTLLEKYHLPCSIGVAPNKFLAKMASDMKKPLGITVLRKREISEMLWPLPIQDMFGVGKKTLEKLLAMNIKTIGDLANFSDDAFLKEVLGPTSAEQLKNHANGNGSNEIDVSRFNDVASISNSQTFEFDEYQKENMLLMIKVLTNSVANRLESHDYKAYTLSLQIKYNNFKLINRSRTLEKATRDSHKMYEIFKELFEEYYDENYPVRLLGVGASKLIEEKEEILQLTMFDELDKIQKDHHINNLINRINNSLGTKALNIGLNKADEENKHVNQSSKYSRKWASEIKDIQKNNR